MPTTDEVNVLLAALTIAFVLVTVATVGLTVIAISLIRDDPSDVYPQNN